MSITVQFFASLREQLGKQQESLDCSTPMSVQDIWSLTSNGLDMPTNTLCAINMEYVKPDALVEDGDEVAFFPPVTGGQ
jgi:molybdopterin synthase sulfur carrier subunit